MAVARFFPGMLTRFAQEAGIALPEEDVDDGFDKEAYPHFTVFANTCLGKAMSDSTLANNASIIAKIPVDKIKKVTLRRLRAMGVDIEGSNYWD